MDIGFLGFGLIGGSIARALRERDPGAHRLVAWSPSGVGVRSAVLDGVLDSVASSPREAVGTSALVVIAAPPSATLELLTVLAETHATQLDPRSIVTDVASTKRQIVERATVLGLPFVGGHPMAGLETTGYATSRADLFVDRPWVVVPGAATEPQVAAVEDLARAVGARSVRMDGAEHDSAVAAISHLPLVLAASLVEAVASEASAGLSGRPDWAVARDLAASGWRDMTRLARGDETMAAGIAATNALELAERIRAVRAALDSWLQELEDPSGADEASLRQRFRLARSLLSRDT